LHSDSDLGKTRQQTSQHNSNSIAADSARPVAVVASPALQHMSVSRLSVVL